MLEYAKKVLPQILAWKQLFKKELMKCINWAEESEKKELYSWCHENFFDIYPDILIDARLLIYESKKYKLAELKLVKTDKISKEHHLAQKKHEKQFS